MSERIHRFWKTHGTSATHLVVLHAFFANPRLERTPEDLSLWYGLPLDRVREVCGELAGCGILKLCPDGIGSYEWNPILLWADPRRDPGSAIFVKRWMETRRMADRAWAAQSGLPVPTWPAGGENP